MRDLRWQLALAALAVLAACRPGGRPAPAPGPVPPADSAARAPAESLPAPRPAVPDSGAPRPAVPDSGAPRPGQPGVVDTIRADTTQPPRLAPRSQRCLFVIENVDRQGVRVEIAPGVENYFAGGNVRLRCANIPVRIASDSVASYQGNVVQFVGRVRYRDSTVAMTADFGTYFRDAEKWEARGNVVLTRLQDETTLRGPNLDYYRAVRGLREADEMYADQRPTITVPVRDSTGEREEPYVVVGDRVRTRGEDRIWAGGRVTIDRADFRGRGDSLQLDTGAGNDGSLIGTAMVRRIAADSFQLRGARIDLTLANRQLTYVTARDSADLVGTDLSLVGDVIGLDIKDRQVDQTLAWGTTVRPVALSNNYEVRGDSLAFDTPDRALREIRAFTDAWIGAKPDSAGDRDWVAGDKVVASFVSRDSAGTRRPALERLEATGKARSLYRLQQSGEPRPSVSYTVADTIVVTMRVTPDSVTVERVFAHGNVEGVHLQPGVVVDSLRADSLRARVDTTGRTRRRR